METNMPARVAGRRKGDGTVRGSGRSQRLSRTIEREPLDKRNEMERKGRRAGSKGTHRSINLLVSP